MERKNPTSPLRKGFDYQDLWGLKLCAEWLSNPSRYKWLQFETIPDEVDTNLFYLDDIVLVNSNDLYSLYQIKHKQNSQDEWTWNDLLTFKDSASSLLNKWFQSFSRKELQNKIGEAIFVTNGLAAEEINKYLIEKKINIEKIKLELPEIYSRIQAQLGDEEAIIYFFKNFNFSFGEQDINELEGEIKDFFYRKLRATQSGINSLLIKIQGECRKQQTAQLNIDMIRKWCEFDEPRPLNEEFAVPKDFEFFDVNQHRKILASLQRPEGGMKVIFGKPGCGKSTYLSRLHKELVKHKISSVKHHYYISSNDATSLERLNDMRIQEAIKAELKKYPDQLGPLFTQNSKNVPLKEFITQLAQYYYGQNKSFIVIIDGLDHVLRYADSNELTGLLKDICFP